jgi:hypothetical protein
MCVTGPVSRPGFIVDSGVRQLERADWRARSIYRRYITNVKAFLGIRSK